MILVGEIRDEGTAHHGDAGRHDRAPGLLDGPRQGHDRRRVPPAEPEGRAVPGGELAQPGVSEAARASPVRPLQAARSASPPDRRHAWASTCRAGKTSIYSATGCARSYKTGFRGRRAIFELLDFTDELRDVILTEPTIAAMKKVIEGGLFTTLAQLAGDSSLRESRPWTERSIRSRARDRHTPPSKCVDSHARGTDRITQATAGDPTPAELLAPATYLIDINIDRQHALLIPEFTDNVATRPDRDRPAKVRRVRVAAHAVDRQREYTWFSIARANASIRQCTVPRREPVGMNREHLRHHAKARSGTTRGSEGRSRSPGRSRPAGPPS